jgi:hypothetical protein
MIEVSLEKMKNINKLGMKNIWNRAKMFSPLEEPYRKSTFKIFVKIEELEMINIGFLEVA